MGRPLKLLVISVPTSIVLVWLFVYMATRSITNDCTSLVTGIDRGDQSEVDKHDVQEEKDDLPSNSTWNACTFDICFNLEKCPLTHPFAVYVYDDLLASSSKQNPFSPQLLVDVLKETGSYTSDPAKACVFFSILWNGESERENVGRLETQIHSLAQWGEYGENHVLVELSTDQSPGRSMLEGVSTGKAIIARSVISPAQPFRTGFDILLPPLRTAEADSVDLLSPLLPVSRETFIHFHGEYSPPKHPGPGAITPDHIRSLQHLLKGKERVDIQLQCQQPATGKTKRAVEGQWMLCGDQKSRLELCSKSMFSLVPSPGGPNSGTGVGIYTRLIESLMCGSIPVVVGVGVLPFDEVIDWSRAALIVPFGRYSDIPYILRSVSSDEIQNFRLKGRHLWHTYFSSPLRVVQIAVAIVRSRTLHPPPPAPDFVGKQLLYLPAPNHKQIPSPSFTNNFTAYSSSFWNDIPGPLFSYPSSPFNPGLHFSRLNEVAIAHNASQSVKGRAAIESTFKKNLLVNVPPEQFTVVIVTYKRNKELMEGLPHLKGIPSLNKVVIVWNNEEDLSSDLKWPDIGVPIVVVRGKGNSLNNKFLPYKEIETEAVLQLDDDVIIAPEEIEFGFRVWCENRERMVGFFGPSHIYNFKDKRWDYAATNCKFSMSLTGCTFIHKTYMYLYSYLMPKEVREMVDRIMDCEDIAMNFLASHLSRKPPMKVPTNSKFDCTGRCEDNLSKKKGWMEERSFCIEFLTRTYGYQPLLYTQSRTDPVTTNIPSVKEYGECMPT
jgi:alpha-1,4-N-acetylglucosaminyltransferase EXTL3